MNWTDIFTMSVTHTRFKTSLEHIFSIIKWRLPCAETSESAEPFQRNAALASCFQKSLFLRTSDGEYQYVFHTKNCSCKWDFSSRIGSLSDLRPTLLLSSITQRNAILGRIPIVEGSARPRDLWQHKTLTRHTSMSNGIRTSKPSKPEVVDSRFRPRGPWGRREPLAQCVAQLLNSKKNFW